MKIKYEWIVQAIVKDKLTGEVKSIHETKNTLVEWGEDYVANLFLPSFIWSTPFPVTAEEFVDYMSIGAWYKLAITSAWDNYITLPYYPVDGSEAIDFYEWCTVYCISGANQGTNKAVITNGYDPITRKLTLATSFSFAPQAGDIYVVSAAIKEIQLQGESETDENGWSISNPKKPIDYRATHLTPLTNEVELRAEWVESEWDYIAAECGLRYNNTAATPSVSSTHVINGTMFARATFANNPPHKTINDILQVRWTLRVGVDRTP